MDNLDIINELVKVETSIKENKRLEAEDMAVIVRALILLLSR